VRYKVVYLASGTHIAAAVVEDVPREVCGVEIRGVVIEHTLYLYQTRDEEGAHYLAAVLNSSVVDKLIKCMQSRGEFGERHIMKKPLELPIPRYDSNNPVHKKLAELGMKARDLVRRKLDEILKDLGYYNQVKKYYNYVYGCGKEEAEPLSPGQVGRLRDRIRKDREMKDILDEIDRLVSELLTVKRSNTLLDYI
jgi:hypothetical protein